jgi:hypothetical protein
MHQFLQVAIAQSISRILTYALQDDTLLVMAAFEADHVLSDNWCSGESSIELLAEHANFATKPDFCITNTRLQFILHR